MKPLKFLHITKTGGTSIEDTAIEYNIKWGRFDDEKEFINCNPFWHGTLKNLTNTAREKYDLFTVVRNPYSRVESEIYCNYEGAKDIKACTNIEEFNKIVTRELNKAVKSNYISSRLHFVPQVNYIDDNVQILRFENLENDFLTLMEKYNIPIKTLKHSKTSCSNRKFTKEHFSRAVIDLINNIYKEDFARLGYDII